MAPTDASKSPAKKSKPSSAIAPKAAEKKEAERAVSPSEGLAAEEDEPPVPDMEVDQSEQINGPANEGDDKAEEGDEEGGEEGEEGDDLQAEEATKEGDDDAEKIDKTIKVEGVFKIQKADGSIVEPVEGKYPSDWTWEKKPLMQEAEDAFNVFKKEGLVDGEKNKHHSLPHGLDFTKCLGIDISDADEAKKCEDLFTEVRKEWKKQFPKSKKQNETAFALYEAQIMADAYEWVLTKFEEEAAKHDEGHKPTDRLKHYRKQAKDRRSKVDNMTTKRKEREEKRKKDAKERQIERARLAPERKEQERAKVANKAVSEFKKSDDFKDIFAKMRTEVKRLMKEEGLDVDAASEKAQATVMLSMA